MRSAERLAVEIETCKTLERRHRMDMLPNDISCSRDLVRLQGAIAALEWAASAIDEPPGETFLNAVRVKACGGTR